MKNVTARNPETRSRADLIARLERKTNESALGLMRAMFEFPPGPMACGTVEFDHHRVAIEVTCLPARFWKFRVTGPNFRGSLSTGSGSLTDFWWAVEALVRGRVRVTRPGNIRCEESGRSYSLTCGRHDGLGRRLRRLLVEGMLVVDPQP